MANVVVDDSLDINQSRGQHRLRAIQGLNLTFYIDTEHEGLIGRVQVQARDVAHLLDEKLIRGKLEAAAPLWLYLKGLEQSMQCTVDLEIRLAPAA
jgi:hypothetical protein